MALVGASGESRAVLGANQDRNLDRAWKYGDTLSPLYYTFRHCLVWRGHDLIHDVGGCRRALRYVRFHPPNSDRSTAPSMAPTVIPLPDNLDLLGFISCSSLIIFLPQLMTHNS